MIKPLMIAHKGDTKNYPENTIESFESAFQKGADGIEFDAHLNSAGVPIVVHDYLFDRTKKYPELREVLEKFGDKGRIELEVKSLEDNAVKMIADVVDKFRPLDLEVTTSVQPILPYLAKNFPNDKRGLIFRKWQFEDWMPKDFKTYWVTRHLELSHATVCHLDLDFYTVDLINHLHKKGLTAHTHLNKSSSERYTKVCELGLDQCTFDDIDILKFRRNP